MMIQDILRSEGRVDFEGVELVYDGNWTSIVPGDIYVAERNQGPRLLTARLVDYEIGCIFPVESAYPYDLGECVKVRLVEEPHVD